MVTKQVLRAEFYRVAFFQFVATVSTMTPIIVALTHL